MFSLQSLQCQWAALLSLQAVHLISSEIRTLCDVGVAILVYSTNQFNSLYHTKEYYERYK